jgi:hypothetical protein
MMSLEGQTSVHTSSKQGFCFVRNAKSRAPICASIMNTLGVSVLCAADLVLGIRRRLFHSGMHAAHALPAIKESNSSTRNTLQDTAEDSINHRFLQNLPGPFFIVPSPILPLWKISMTVGPHHLLRRTKSRLSFLMIFFWRPCYSISTQTISTPKKLPTRYLRLKRPS